MDYLVRDSHFAGVALGRVDIYYLIHCLTIVEHDENSLCSLGVEEKGVKAYEGFALARQLMNRTVYYHRAVQVFEFMIEELLRQVISEFDMLHRDPELHAVIGGCVATERKTGKFTLFVLFIGVTEWTQTTPSNGL